MTDYLDDDPHLRRRDVKPTPADIEAIKREACGGLDDYDFDPQTEEWSKKPVEKYPLIKELGLEVVCGNLHTEEFKAEDYYVFAADLERLLEKGVRVYSGEGFFPVDHIWNIHNDSGMHTKSALLINIQPIKQPEDTAESLLKELIEKYGDYQGLKHLEQLVDRAKALLEKSEGGK